MKKIISTIVFLFIGLVVFAKPVSADLAKKTGANFLQTQTTGANISGATDLILIQATTFKDGNEIILSYIFNTPKGFVIVAGDDRVNPILAYSTESHFNLKNIAPQIASWFSGYNNQIAYIVNSNIEATPEIANKWAELVNLNPIGAPMQSNGGVSPLLKTTWDQLPYYNASCPYDNIYSQNAVTGCVATAMAQVMKFWNYPSSGSDFHSYNDKNYGTQSADFGSTTYQWTSMPNSVTSQNNAVATLMYHCGVSVNMGYGVAKTGGSSAYVISSASPITNCTEYALKTYFGYKSTLAGVARSNYSDANWISALEKELDNGRPVIYAGFGSGGGHCFVADGYDANNYFHFNWGWSGQNNGYFQLNALNPGSLGTGGGSGGYNSGQQAILGIQPTTTGGTSSPYDLRLYNYVTPSASTIPYGNGFSVTTNIINKGTKDFSGDYCAAIFDNTNAFIDYVQILSSYTLPSTYVYKTDLTFTHPASFALLPGTYKISVYYRPSGGKWSAVTDNSGYTNSATITISNKDNLEMYASMSVSPSGTLTIGKSVSVHLDIANYGTSTFSGSFSLGLYNFDGTGAASIQKLTGLTLNSKSHYSSGLTFTNSSLNVKSGTYLLALTYIPDGTSGNYLIGSTYFANPIKITVQEAPLLPDKYEVNDDIAHAYNLGLNYSNNSAGINTTGSNCHTGSDVDYYKIVLPSGYNYTIKGHLDDSRYTTDGNTYSLDAVFSYSIDGGSTWSATFDDIMPNDLTINGSATVYIKVAPYFQGQVGTYLLELSVDRTVSNSGINTHLDAEGNINIFPIPASEMLHIDLSGCTSKINSISILDIAGKQMLVTNNIKENAINNLPINGLPAGLYFVDFTLDDKIFTRKITICK